MERTWASGAIELIKHADSHIELPTAFDSRIAFISIDNAVETMIRTFVSMPRKISGIHVSRKEYEEAEQSFSRLLELLSKHAASRLTGVSDVDIEHYHRIRNKIYHEGTGFSVDREYLLTYRRIAVLLLKNLFDVALPDRRNDATLEQLVVIWNDLQERLKNKDLRRELAESHPEALPKLKELQQIRNEQVHSSKIDRKKIAAGIDIANHLLRFIGAIF